MSLFGTMNMTFLAALDRCSTLDSGENRHACLAGELAHLPLWPSSRAAVDYFYDAKPYPGVHMRLPGCVTRHPRGGGTWYNKDVVWERNESAVAGDECLWGNMAFGKLLLIILLARAVGATHLIESGRMGGMSLMHYSHFGFNLTSVELLPVRHVEETLRRMLPAVRLRDGSGMELVPAAIAEIYASDPAARIAVVIDGPKDALAEELARRIRNSTTLIIIDDMKLAAAFRAAWPHATAEVSDPGWQRAFPLRRDAAAITRPPNPHGAFEFEAKTNLRSRRAHQIDRASVLLGARCCS